MKSESHALKWEPKFNHSPEMQRVANLIGVMEGYENSDEGVPAYMIAWAEAVCPCS